MYGVLYTKPCFPIGHRLEWLNYCALSNILPIDLQNELKELSNRINSKYKDSIIIPMDSKVNSGCVTTPELIGVISNEIYDGMTLIYKKLSNCDNCIVLVYGVGEMSNINVKSTHDLDSYPIMIKLGRLLDNSKPGIFKA